LTRNDEQQKFLTGGDEMARRKEKMDEHALPSLSLVFGYIAIKELQRLPDRIAVLDRLGYGTAEIAAICGTTPATVRQLKYTSKKSARR
jgi:hypothetical protein